jgi:hypothetical protein
LDISIQASSMRIQLLSSGEGESYITKHYSCKRRIKILTNFMIITTTNITDRAREILSIIKYRANVRN